MNQFSDSADDLARALTDTLRETLEAVPHLLSDPERLATHLSEVLSVRLAEAVAAAGGTASRLARALATPPRPSATEGDSIEARVLAVLTRHPAGRDPGMTPDALAALTGLAPGVLGTTVSAMVQAGDLVRDAWLVRLPHADDLLPENHAAGQSRSGQLRHATERRAIGDRRALGERRLFERRTLP